MEFSETAEHTALRKTVAAIAGSFGGRYYAEKAEAGEPCTELWRALGDAGFIGVNIPEEYGGGGGGMVELAMVCEEPPRGCPLLLLLVSRRSRAEVIAGTAPRSSAGAGCPGSPTAREGGLRDHRAGRRLQHPPARHHRPPRRRRLGAARHEVLHLRRRRGARRAASSPAPGPTSAATRSCRCSWCRPTRPGLRRPGSRWTSCCPEKQFTPVLRRRAAARRTRWSATRAQGFRQVFHGLNPERITGAAIGVGIARYALAAAALRAHPRGVGPSRSAPTRASPTRSPRRRSRPSWPR